VEYILRNFDENDKRFFDRSVVGTGHRGVLNLQYPIYAYSFPLVALSRLNKLLKSNNCGKKLDHALNKALDKIFK